MIFLFFLISPLLAVLWPWKQFSFLFFTIVNTHNKSPLLLFQVNREKKGTRWLRLSETPEALRLGNTAQQHSLAPALSCLRSPRCVLQGEVFQIFRGHVTPAEGVLFLKKARHCRAKYTLYWTWPLICLFAVATWGNYTGEFPFNILLYGVAFTQALFPQLSHLGRCWCLPPFEFCFLPPRWRRAEISVMRPLSSRSLKCGLMS